LQKRRADGGRSVGQRQRQAGGEAHGTGRDAGAQHPADRALERAHRAALTNISTETMTSTVAISIFSHSADARWPNRMPPHEPTWTPSTAAAASTGTMSPRP